MARELSPYTIRRARPTRRAQFTVLAEDVESNIQDDLQQYWRVIRKHLGIVLTVPVILVMLVILRDAMTIPLYSAGATVLIRNSPPPVLESASVTIVSQNPDAESLSEDETQIQLLKSRTLAARVVAAEGLANDPVFLGRRQQPDGVWKPVSQWLHARLGIKHHAQVPPSPEPQNSAAASTRALVGAYLSALTVTPVHDTQMVTIGFTTPDPALSARLANAHAREFISWGIEINAHQSEEAEHFLEGKLAQIREQLEASEAAVNRYRRDKGIVPGLISVNGKQDVVLERLNKLSSDLQEAHLQTIALGTQVAMIKEGRQEALPSVIENTLVQKLKAQLDEDEAQYATLSGRFKPDYPPMIQLQRKIAGTRNILNQEIRNAEDTVKTQFFAAQQRENALQHDLNAEKAYAFGLNDSAVRYLILEREADSNRELYNAILKRVKDLTVVADVHASNVSLVDQAEPPGGPSYPNRNRDATTALVLGLAAGIGLAFLMDLLDNTLKDSREVERYLRLPSLALIPEAPKMRESLYPAAESGDPKLLNGSYRNSYKNQSVVTYNGRYSLLGEAYRNLRTALMLSRAGSHPRTTLITSAVPEEGKTTVSVNTAIVLAHARGRVLLIDADLRIPQCHRRLGLSNLRGLTEVLTGLCTAQEAIQLTEVENLFLLSSGQMPPNPSELLGSPQMRELLAHLIQSFDHIIIDSPPALPVSDPIVLSQLVDGVVLVASGSRTPKQQVKAALSRLRHAHAKVFGIVLNRIKLHKVDYFYPYYKYYGAPADEEIEDRAADSDDAVVNQAGSK
jgi:succinoglycan biosynthesis transport protein ExoP